MPQFPRTRLALEHLETRETPSISVTEPFNVITPPALPAGWGEWSNDGSDVFRTATGSGVDGSGALASSAGSRTRGLAWHPQQVAGDSTVAASVKVESLVPTFVFARGLGLGTPSPSYLAAVVKRGVAVELVEVKGDSQTVLASVASPGAAYYSGGWVRVSLVPNGTSASVQVTRADTGQYLNAQGRWQTAPTAAITGTTTLPSAPGLAGIGRAASVWGPVQIDDFNLTEPVVAPVGVNESFDTTTVGARPTGWSSWANDANGFQVVTTRANTTPNGFASNGGSPSAARAWADVATPADVEASAAVYLDSIIPAQLFVRGSSLDTPTPTYYGVAITRGLEAKVVRVVNGVETPLGSIKSMGYFSSQWLRVHLSAEGDRLRVTLYRADTRQWLTPDGGWSDSPDFALEVRDGAITGGGKAGVGRKAQFSGPVTFDDFTAEAANATSGPVVNITPVASPVVGEVTFRATVTGGTVSRIEFRLNNQLRAVESASPAEWAFDSTTVANGSYTLTVRAFDANGDYGSSELVFTVANPNATPIPIPTIPRHYSHIRIAELAYSGNPMGEFEKKLLRESVDVVVPNPRYFPTIEATSSATPQLIYSNVSNLYQGLLTDWLNFADTVGAKRELAFYHVTRPTDFSGNSSSSQPVTWFWGTHQTSPTGTVTDVTSAARGGRNFNVTFGATGTSTSVSYPDKFREMNFSLVTGGASGWGGVWEYVSAVDASGKPTAWKTLTPVSDGTAGLTRSGTITFDPPADWKTSFPATGAERLFSVRFRVTSGTAAQGAELKTLFGRDYVRAFGGTSGVIPAFDSIADRDGDGYLTDAEYAGRRAGYDARFYESRLFYPYYGQMRFVTNPSSSALRSWAADYHDRLLDKNPLADGVFLDNAHGKLPFAGVSVVEPTTTYSTDSGALTAAVSRKIAPQWVMANTAGGTSEGDGVAAGSASVIEEFLLRPMEANWSEVGDAANLVARRLAASSSPYVVLDTYPGGGSPLDPRTQVGALAYYYLVADPDRTMLMFFGGSNPSSSWYEHWSAAAAVNVGKPTGEMRVFATGSDPANAALTYKVFARDYGNALVLYKPLSYATGKGEGTTANATATTHQLGGNYRTVNADGTLGPVVSQVALRNGEGAVLVRA